MAIYIWQSDRWPALVHNAGELQGHFQRALTKAGFLAGLRSSFSTQEQRDRLVDEIIAETIDSYAIEGVSLDPGQVRGSIADSLSALVVRQRDNLGFRTPQPLLCKADSRRRIGHTSSESNAVRATAVAFPSGAVSLAES